MERNITFENMSKKLKSWKKRIKSFVKNWNITEIVK